MFPAGIVQFDYSMDFCSAMHIWNSLYSMFCTGCLSAMAALQVACVNVNEALESGRQPLHEALENQDAAEVKRLLAAGAKPGANERLTGVIRSIAGHARYRWRGSPH